MHRMPSVVRRGRVHDVLHEGAPVARFAVPGRAHQVAAGERARQVVIVEHSEPVSGAVHALEPQPLIGNIRSAQRVHTGGVDGACPLEVRLDHAVIAAGLKDLGAIGEGPANVGAAPGRHTDGVRVDVAVDADPGVTPAEHAQRPHRRSHAL